LVDDASVEDLQIPEEWRKRVLEGDHDGPVVLGLDRVLVCSRAEDHVLGRDQLSGRELRVA
jgi:hypothetical protein